MPYLFSEPKMQLRYDTLLYYMQPVYDFAPSKLFTNRACMNFKGADTYTGTVTMHTKKRISKAINIMLQSLEQQTIRNPVTKRVEKFKINFITLTIPGNERKVTPKEGYELLLKPFLQWLTKTKNTKTYIWKAELQQNGQLHYHITTSTWIYYRDIRTKWNYLLFKNNLLDEFVKSHSHADPNSTDVHKVYKIRNISAYMHKELCKNVQGTETYVNRLATELAALLPIEQQTEDNIIRLTEQIQKNYRGKIWDCSTNLKGQKYFTVEFNEEHEGLLYKASRKMHLTEFETPQCTIIKGNKTLSKLLLTNSEKELYAEWIMSIRKANTMQFTAPPGDHPENLRNSPASPGSVLQEITPGQHKKVLQSALPLGDNTRQYRKL